MGVGDAKGKVEHPERIAITRKLLINIEILRLGMKLSIKKKEMRMNYIRISISRSLC